jgi:hypothetical protein
LFISPIVVSLFYSFFGALLLKNFFDLPDGLVFLVGLLLLFKNEFELDPNFLVPLVLEWVSRDLAEN